MKKETKVGNVLIKNTNKPETVVSLLILTMSKF